MEFFSPENLIQNNLGLFFDSLKKGDIVLLNADLGMGKTTLVRSFIESRFSKQGIKDIFFSSPSYNLIQEYKLPEEAIIHIDLYRLDDEDQLESVGLWEVLENKNSITFIEWASKIDVADLPRRNIYEIQITQKPVTGQDPEEQRQYQIKKIS